MLKTKCPLSPIATNELLNLNRLFVFVLPSLPLNEIDRCWSAICRRFGRFWWFRWSWRSNRWTIWYQFWWQFRSCGLGQFECGIQCSQLTCVNSHVTNCSVVFTLLSILMMNHLLVILVLIGNGFDWLIALLAISLPGQSCRVVGWVLPPPRQVSGN